MKKSLLAVAFATAGLMTASAGKVAIVVENEDFYSDADEIVTIHVGDQNPTLVSNAFTWRWYKLNEADGASAQVNCSFHWYEKTQATLTVAPGVTITKIEAYTPTSMGKTGAGPEEFTWTIPFNDDFKVDGSTLTWTGSLGPGQSMDMKPAGQSRFTLIEVTYTGTPELPLMPTASPEPTVIAAQESVELMTEEKGGQIYYAIDEDANASSTLYTGPITLTRGVHTINAVTVKDGKVSPQMSNTYVVAEQGLKVVKYDFRSLDELTMPNKEWPAKASSSAYNIYLTDVVLENEEVSVEAVKNDSNSKPRMAMSTNGGFIEMRVYTGNSLVISVPDTHYIGTVLCVGSGMNGFTEAPADVEGDFKTGGYNTSYVLWQAKGDYRGAQYIEFPVASGTNYLDNLYVCYAPKTNSGVDAIEVDNSNAPVVYYNLQGMQVSDANLTPGIYIKRQGTKAEKIYVK